MKQIGIFLFEIAREFSAHGFIYPQRQAEDLLCDLLNCSRLELSQRKESFLSEKEEALGDVWRRRRLMGEPLAYLSERVVFYNCFLKVNSHVLIPRQETEILVEKIVQELKADTKQDKILWDLCSGSGCIGIALKKALPELTVSLVDLFPEAVALAKANAELNQVTVECLKGDLLEPFRGRKAHYVVCNPPYVSEEEYLSLDQEVKAFEPVHALIGGEDGLAFYRRLSKELPFYLYSHAKVWLEIGYRQGEEMEKIFSQDNWKKKRLEKDWAGHPRFFFLENE